MHVMKSFPKAETKPLRNIIDIRVVDKNFIERVFSRAEMMTPRHYDDTILRGKRIAWLGRQPSTRTMMSFESATQDLGGMFFRFPYGNSSEEKNESPEDSIRVVSRSHDIIVIRAPDQDFPWNAATIAMQNGVCVINAGNGPDQHPTQTIIDLFTVRKKRGRIEGLNFLIAGDLGRGRAPRTLEMGLAAHYPKNTVYRCPCPGLEMGEDVVKYSASRGLKTYNIKSIGEVVGDIDVFYLTRLQSEVSLKGIPPDLNHYPVLTPEIAAKAKSEALFLHPLPRDTMRELPYAIDVLRQAVYMTDQLDAHGQVRKAILQELLLGK